MGSGLNYSDELLGNLAINGVWDTLLLNKDKIKVHKNNEMFHGLSFHEWLLTNPDKGAFELWKELRGYAKKNGSYDEFYWKNAAALVLYADLPERLKDLYKEEWQGEINCSLLIRGRGVNFKPNLNLSERVLEKVTSSLKSNLKLSALDISCVRGYADIIEKSLMKMNERPPPYKMIKLYLMNESHLPIEPLMDILKHYTEYHSSQYIAFRVAFELSNLEQMKEIWGEASTRGKTTIIEKLKDAETIHFIQEELFKNEQIDMIEYINSILISETGQEINYNFDTFWDSVKNDKIKSVNFMLDRHPEWLEECRESFCNITNGCRVGGTVLALSAMNSKTKMFDYLIEHGANIKSLSNFMLLSGADKIDSLMLARVEKILLKLSLGENSTNLKDNKTTPLYGVI